MTRTTAPSLRLFVIAVATALVVGLTFAATALAEDMPGMDMSGDQMQTMPPTDPTAAPVTDMGAEEMPGMDMSGGSAAHDGDAHGGMADMPGMDGTANWLVVGGFLALIAAATAAAVVVKRRLRDKMLRGELATEGVLDA